MSFRSFRVTLRSFLKRPVYSFINVFGLGLGLACFALITLFVRQETSYDKHHEDAERIYRIGMIATPPSSEPDRFAVTSSVVGQVVRDEFSQVQALTRVAGFEGAVTMNGQDFYDDVIRFVEQPFFDVFTLPSVLGTTDAALERPGTAVITRTTATKYFADTNPVGQSLVINDSTFFEVTAVVEDLPSTSHFDGDIFLSYATRLQQIPENDQWLNLQLHTYLKTAPGIDFASFEQQIAGLAHEKIGDELAQVNFGLELVLEPLTDIYLTSDLGAQIGPTGDMTQVLVFSAVAMFILLLAGINFTNLSTARSMERAREVGVRKSVGSSRAALVSQFLGESVTTAVLALVFGLVLALASVGVLNDMASRDIARSALFAPDMLGILLAATVVSGLLGGLYPALMLSSFKPVDVLKGSNHSTPSGAFVRKSLVAAQFAISIGLIAGTIVVNQQLDYMRSRDLGFDQEQMLVVDAQALPRSRTEGRTQTILDQFEAISQVRQASMSETIPGRGQGRFLFRTENLPEDDIRSAAVVNVGFDFFDNYGIGIVAGRGFDRNYETDLEGAIIVNETLVEYVGYPAPESALGQVVPVGGGGRIIVGVLSDYHHASLREVIQPTMYFPTDRVMNYISLRVAGQEAMAATQAVEGVWSALFPEMTFESFFLDDDFNRQYQSEERLQHIFFLFSALAIIIACLGLFGLAAFAAQQRTKEIGVRKVLGASVPSIVGLLSKEFAVLVVVGLALSVPGVFFGLGRWLEAFPYRIDVAWWVFLVSGLAALAIALLTVGYQALRAAGSDPVKSLRYE